ncbi:MAG: hypothetical protein A3G20_08240 [Acidobacteria bacterium RIFCSPLOWO2_12_FULL_59_11]|nr:MAG: hypothetical protein A3G20_08240 [Acidobacteria bacterium RIFCSPLOWO2_12_FULL_59_11]
MENFQDADELVTMLRRLLSSRGSELVQQKKLRGALHNLEAELKGGSKTTASRKRVTRSIAVIGKALCEEFSKK